MCGIAGIVAPEAERYRDALQRMTDALTHRGPDGEGRHFYQNCALGHRRLAIIDIETGVQPMRSQDGRAAVTFNGEIYGYQELRSRLSAYPFRTHSDTEVILALYARYGDQALTHLPGMFAFAIWNKATQELFSPGIDLAKSPFITRSDGWGIHIRIRDQKYHRIRARRAGPRSIGSDTLSA